MEKREIKFRAWHEGSATWLDFTLEELVEGRARLFSKLSRWCAFTGLNDKYGKEIYEGDVLRHETTLGPSGPEHQWHGPFVVEWKSFGWQPFFGQLPERCEVIGNIYENPNLI